MRNIFRQPKLFLILFVGLESCGSHLPPITVCVYQAATQVFHCIDREGYASDIKGADPAVDKHICIPADDFNTLLTYFENSKN